MAIKELFNDSRPQVLFDPRASQRIDPRFKFTRDGVASYWDAQGVLRYAAKNEPRVNTYELDSAGNPHYAGFLVEKSATNRERQSTLDWAVTSGTKTLNAAISPDLSSSATLLDGGISSPYVANHTPAGSYSTNWCLRFYAKPQTVGTGSIVFAQGGTGLTVSFDFSTKTFSGSSAWTSIASYKPIINGWYELSFTQIYVFNAFEFFLSTTSSSVPVYLWGYQFEAGQRHTSYIPASGSEVTRLPDLISIEAPLPSTGSIYIDARSLTSDVDTTLLSAAPASPSTDKLALAIRQPANLFNSKALVYEVDGAFKPTLPFPVPSVVQERNLITYGANNYHYRSDSARYTPSSSTSVPANMTRLGIGHDVTDPTKAMTGYINAVYLWPGEITPTVAEALVRGDVDPKDADAGVFTPAAGSLAFVFNTQGTATDGNTVVQLPLRGSTNNVLVDWGDNTSSSLIGSAASVTVNHTYPAAGIYPVQIEADSDGTNSGLAQLQFYANSPADLVRVLQWGGSTTFQPTTMYRIFRDCTQLDFATAARTNLPDTSAITDWREAFYSCSSISGLFPSFNFSSATTFNSTWRGCSSMTAFAALGNQTQNVANFNSAWYGCSGLTSFPLIDTSSGTDFAYAWYGCSGLTAFPLINTGAATSVALAWYNCSGLTSFPLLNFSNVTSVQEAWRNCTGLTSFPLLDTSACKNFQRAWFNCSSLTSFPQLNFTGNTSAGSFYQTWYGCSSLTSFPLISTNNVNSFGGSWELCSSLTSFPLLDSSNVTYFAQAWRACSSLTAFPALDTSAGTNFYETWLGCSSLTSFPALNTSSGTNFFRAWQSCTGLTAFPALDLSAATGTPGPNNNDGLKAAWRSCVNLATFPANMFDAVASTNYEFAFETCALTAQSIENILVSINTAGTSNGNLTLSGGTNANTSTWSTAANNAYIALVGRGWTITQNGTAPS